MTEAEAPPVFGPEGVLLPRWERKVEAALNSSSITSEPRAVLKKSLTQFQSAKTGMLDVFVDLTKGFEVRFMQPFAFMAWCDTLSVISCTENVNTPPENEICKFSKTAYKKFFLLRECRDSSPRALK